MDGRDGSRVGRAYKGRWTVEFEDVLEPEVGVAVAVTAAVTAAVASPPVRRALRQGLVYGLAGLLMAGDRIAAAARGAAQEAQRMTSAAAQAANQAEEHPATAEVGHS